MFSCSVHTARSTLFCHVASFPISLSSSSVIPQLLLSPSLSICRTYSLHIPPNCPNDLSDNEIRCLLVITIIIMTWEKLHKDDNIFSYNDGVNERYYCCNGNSTYSSNELLQEKKVKGSPNNILKISNVVTISIKN